MGDTVCVEEGEKLREVDLVQFRGRGEGTYGGDVLCEHGELCRRDASHGLPPLREHCSPVCAQRDKADDRYHRSDSVRAGIRADCEGGEVFEDVEFVGAVVDRDEVKVERQGVGDACSFNRALQKERQLRSLESTTSKNSPHSWSPTRLCTPAPPRTSPAPSTPPRPTHSDLPPQAPSARPERRPATPPPPSRPSSPSCPPSPSGD